MKRREKTKKFSLNTRRVELIVILGSFTFRYKNQQILFPMKEFNHVHMVALASSTYEYSIFTMYVCTIQFKRQPREVIGLENNVHFLRIHDDI